jgi:hypothetical protein
MGKTVLFASCNALQDRTARSGGESARAMRNKTTSPLGPLFPTSHPISRWRLRITAERRARALMLTHHRYQKPNGALFFFTSLTPSPFLLFP